MKSSSRLVPEGESAMSYGTATPIEQELWAPLSSVTRAQGRGRHRTRVSLIAATGFLIVVLAALMITVPIEYEIEQSGISLAPPTTLSKAEIVPPGQPREIHIALYDVSSSLKVSNVSSDVNPAVGVTISWATANSTRMSTVRFGTDATKLTSVTQAKVPCVKYDFCSYTSPCIHHVTLEGSMLLPSTTYYYQCGDDEAGWSAVRAFHSVAAVGGQEPSTFAMIGDLGQTIYSEQTLRHLENQRGLSAVVHAGDLAYADNDQSRWDRWEQLVEPLASIVPWMIVAGNHEKEKPCQPNVDCFVAYQVRFRMPFESNNVLQQKNLFYSFRTGMIHFIMLTPYVPTDSKSNQYKWLEEELSRVDRSLTPWVCAVMHGPWYNSNKLHQGPAGEPQVGMKKDMEELFNRHQVDLVLAGHVHAYERTHPVYKGEVRKDGAVYIVAGAGGNREGLAAKFLDPKPVWSAVREAYYGFVLLHVQNRTHALIESYQNHDQGDATRIDAEWLTTTQFRMAHSD